MFRKKTLATKVALAAFFLFSGIEYGVIIPTLWPYLEDLGARHAFYGLTFSAYPLSGLIAAVVFGVVSDRLGVTKPLVVFATAFQVSPCQVPNRDMREQYAN
jgi:ceroid-lipofuscinosis MFS transporter 7